MPPSATRRAPRPAAPPARHPALLALVTVFTVLGLGCSTPATPKLTRLDAASTWVGPRGLDLVCDTEATLVLADGSPSGRALGPIGPTVRHLDPIALGLPHGAPLTLFARASAPGPALHLALDLEGPRLRASAPAPSALRELTTLTLTFDDDAGLDPLATSLALALDHASLPPPARASARPDTLALELPAPLPEGHLALRVQPVDLLGNLGEPTTLTFELDRTGPPITLRAPLPHAHVASPLTLDLDPTGPIAYALTDHRGLTLTGVATSTPIAIDALAEGPLTLTLSASDSLENQTILTVPLTLDRSGPTLVTLHPAPGSALRPPFELRVYGADPAGLDLLRVADQVTPFVDGLASLTLATLPEALHLRDRLGHETTLHPGWRLDTSPPTVHLEPAPNDAPSAPPRPLLERLALRLDDPGCGPDLQATAASLRLAHDGRSAPLEVLTTDTHLELALPTPAGGTWTLDLTPTDRCGNAAPATALYLVDAEGPALDLRSTSPEAVNGPVPLTIDAYDLDGLAAVSARASVGPAATAWRALPTDPTTTLELDPGDLPDGPLVLEVEARDRAGNATSATLHRLLDRTPPELFADAPGWLGSHFELTLELADPTSGLASFTVTRADTGATLATGPAPSSPLTSTFSTTLALTLMPTPNPSITLMIEAADRAGNTTLLPFTRPLDLAPPLATALTSDAVLEAMPPLAFALSDPGSGPSPPTSLVQVTHDDLPTTCARADARTTVSLTCPSLAGRWRVELTPRDLAGNLGAPATIAIDLDLAPPILTFAGASADGWSSGARAPITLVAEDDTAVETIDLHLVAASDPTGPAVAHTLTHPPWHTELDLAPLADGELELTAIATDRAGRTATAAGLLRVDNWPPALSVTAPAARVGPRFELLVDASDEGAGLEAITVATPDSLVVGRLTLDGAATARAPVAVVLPASAAEIEPVTLDVTAADRVGRTTTTRLGLEVDAAPPTLTPSPAPGTLLTAGATLTLHLADPSGVDLPLTRATLAMTLDGRPRPTSATLLPDGLRVLTPASAQGELVLSVTPTDRLGNTTSLRFTWPLDARGPSLTRSLPASGATNQHPLSPLELTFDEPIASPDLSLRGEVDGRSRSIPFTTQLAGATITLVPDEPLRSTELVILTLGPGLTDLAGNPLIPPTIPPSLRVMPYAFIDLASELGLAAYRGGTSEPGENHGPGGLFTDLDEDGYPELILPSRAGEPLVLHQNRPSDSRLGRALTPLPLRSPQPRAGTGAIAADVDNDGDRDVFLTYWDAPDVLLRNVLAETGTLGFDDMTAATAPAEPGQHGVGTSEHEGVSLDLTMTAAFADVDRDGLVDLYVGHHNGHWNAPQMGLLPGQRDTLYRQLPDGTFRDVTMEAGVPGWQDGSGAYVTSYQTFSSTMAVTFVDLDDDRWPDLVVTNKTRHPADRDLLYRNLGVDEDGLWRGFEPLNWALPSTLDGPPWGGANPLAMGVDASDVDNDGDLDLYITDWSPTGTVPGPNELWLNRFADTGVFDLLRSPEATGVYSWGAQLQDFDNDGRVDLHVATNVGEWDLLYMQRRTPTGWAFVDEALAAAVRQRRNSRGSMTADLDRDGQVDLVVINLDGPPRVFWNRWDRTLPTLRHWLTVHLVGDPDAPGPFRSTRDALGAKLIAHADVDGDGTPERLTRHVVSGSSCAGSTSSLALELGLGLAPSADLEIRWPSGHTTWLHAVPADQHLLITESPPYGVGP